MSNLANLAVWHAQFEEYFAPIRRRKGAGKDASYHTPMRYLHLFTLPDAFTTAARIRARSITMESCSCYSGETRQDSD
jgi:hypothetical protein